MERQAGPPLTSELPSRGLISVVIPVCNEEENIEPLTREILAVADERSLRVEVLFVDDGSTDRTASHIRRLIDCDRRIRLIEHTHNRGQTAALRTGIESAEGSVIVTMDGDGQNDPADIPALLDEIDADADLVCGWRVDRQDVFLLKRLPSLLGNLAARGLTNPAIHDTGCTLKAMTAHLAKGLPLYSGMHRFIPALATLEKATIREIPVHHRARTAGASKYGLGRTVSVLCDLIVLQIARGLMPLFESFAETTKTRRWQMLAIAILLVGTNLALFMVTKNEFSQQMATLAAASWLLLGTAIVVTWRFATRVGNISNVYFGLPVVIGLGLGLVFAVEARHELLNRPVGNPQNFMPIYQAVAGSLLMTVSMAASLAFFCRQRQMAQARRQDWKKQNVRRSPASS